jgi:hypothetical protein
MDLARVTWRKSSHSTQNGSCIEAGTTRASIKGSGNEIAVRDSTDRGGPALIFTTAAWREFTATIKSGALA